jgi:hypothetical protein
VTFAMFSRLSAGRRAFGAAVLSAAITTLLLTIPACTGSGGGGSSGTAPTPSGATCSPYGFAPNLPPTPTSSPLPAATRGAFCLTGQTFSGTFSTTINIQGFADSVGACAPDAVYRFSSRGFVNGTCVGPVSPVTTVTFAADYVGDFRRTNPVCIQTSRIDFRSFTVTGTPLDSAIAEAAKSDIHQEFDFELATKMNGIVNGSTASPVSRGSERCSGWTLNPTRPAPST